MTDSSGDEWDLSGEGHLSSDGKSVLTKRRSKVTASGRPSASVVFRISKAELSSYFHLPLQQAAKNLGVCPTIVKRACRFNGIERWPYQVVRKRKSSMKLCAGSSSDTSSASSTTLNNVPTTGKHMPQLTPLHQMPKQENASSTLPGLQFLALTADSLRRLQPCQQPYMVLPQVGMNSQEMALLIDRFLSFPSVAKCR